MKNNNTWFWLFLAPVMLALFFVVILPLIFGIYYSFTDWNGIIATRFVGIKNYINVFQSTTFLNALWFTTKFAVVAIIMENVIGLALAMLVTQKFKGRHLLRTVFFMPNLIGGLILGFIWQFIFIKAFAAVGNVIGVSALESWLATPGTGFWGMIILMSWQYAGYIMVIYIAYLENVDHELIEAAEIDGASAWQRFLHITIPMIAPAFTINVFLTLSNSFKLYDQNLSLTAGGPYDSTQMLAMDIYNTAFSQNNMALGQSKAVVFFLIVAIISLTQVYYSKKREVEV
ncbi:carbohydrate ABC transporter permease [Sporolactobacillus spathodeae]|uniref:Raffinose/stachyose/melibiose transport system permease protein n=1 Tax=Sporolactobacillus spathodeae TaxID=1465502 RepID=A0ABS2Q4F5_9BACL|nr:sugar ABC transporter permease [Sporolactobacillus spathodeae]MBM7656669.1 raffinose/stachyose/melibiose transport system permease protein [Sporolactobacillus spathodeae]